MAIVVKRSVTSGEANLKAEMLDLFYPVGSYYETSDTSFDPNTAWGGTWVEDTDGRVLVALDSGTFDTVGDTGGAESHSHKYGMQYGAYYRSVSLEENPANTVGMLSYDTSGNITLSGSGTNMGSQTLQINTGATTSSTTASMATFRMTGDTQYKSNLQPYVVVKRWHRTA